MQDGQDAGQAVIYAEAKLGELLKGIDKSKSYTGFAERNPVMPPGISKQTSHQAQTIASNPEKVQAAIEKAIQVKHKNASGLERRKYEIRSGILHPDPPMAILNPGMVPS